MPTGRVPATGRVVSSPGPLGASSSSRIRAVKITVGATPTRTEKTWPYPNGDPSDRYLVPVYRCAVEGTTDEGLPVKDTFEVLRFGVHCMDGHTATVVGLADGQTHVIKAWIPSYTPHSARSIEDGAWQVYGNFLIHDGPDDSTEIFATAGCIEIMGPRGFVRFNDLIIALSGSSARDRTARLLQIGRAGRLSITYEGAARPPLQKAP